MSKPYRCIRTGQMFFKAAQGDALSPGIASCQQEFTEGEVLMKACNRGLQCTLESLRPAFQYTRPVPKYVSLQREGKHGGLYCYGFLRRPATLWEVMGS